MGCYLFIAFWGAACAPTRGTVGSIQQDTAAVVSDEADADTDTDTDTDTDADTDTDTGPGLCSPRVPANTEVLHQDAVIAESDAAAWVCRNKELSLAGDRGVVFVEFKGLLTLSGEDSTVYVRDNAEVVVLSGSHTIYAEPEAVIDASAEGVEVVRELCAELEFDDTKLSGDGC